MIKPAIEKINLIIHQDWTKLTDLTNRVLVQGAEGKLPKGKFYEEYDDYRYDLNTYGSVFFLDSLSDPGTPKYSSSMIGGKIVETLLPWSADCRKLFDGLNLVSFTYFVTKGNLAPHSDGHLEGQADEGHCRLNYIVNDTDAMTYVDNDGKIESYPSHANTAWLLDTTKTHWVVNSQYRQVLQFNFSSSFDKVFNYISNLSKIEFGN
jgi:hypothetical protein